MAEEIYGFSEENARRLLLGMRDVERLKAEYRFPTDETTSQGSELVAVEVTSATATNGRWPGKMYRLTNSEKGTTAPNWDVVEDDNEDVITVQVVPLRVGSLTVGDYWAVVVGATEPDDPDEVPELVLAAIGPIASGSSIVDTVHVVGIWDEFDPPVLTGWFVRQVTQTGTSFTEPASPTHWKKVYEGSSLVTNGSMSFPGTPKLVDPDDGTASHATTLYRNSRDPEGWYYITFDGAPAYADSTVLYDVSAACSGSDVVLTKTFKTRRVTVTPAVNVTIEDS